MVTLVKNEHHSVTSSFTYSLDDTDVIETFGSMERFDEIVSYNGNQFGHTEPIGDKPTDEETDKFWDYIQEHDYDNREDDWVSDRKGGYEVDVELIDDKEKNKNGNSSSDGWTRCYVC